MYVSNDLMESKHSPLVHCCHRLLIALKYLGFHQFRVKAEKNFSNQLRLNFLYVQKIEITLPISCGANIFGNSAKIAPPNRRASATNISSRLESLSSVFDDASSKS